MYVKLFREVYEYAGGDPNKLIRRTRIRTLIDNHQAFSSFGYHGDGMFLPWHRWYILELETILLQHQQELASTTIAVNCDEIFYGIPYFDWHNLPCNVIPRDFINHPAFHDSLGEPTPPNSPTTACVGGGLSGFSVTTAQCLTRSWTTGDSEKFPELNLHPLFPFPTNYDQFRHQLENGPGLMDLFMVLSEVS